MRRKWTWPSAEVLRPNRMHQSPGSMLGTFLSVPVEVANDSIGSDAKQSFCENEACGSRLLWQHPIGAREVTGVTAGIPQKVILVFGFGLPEIAFWFDLRHDFAGPNSRRVDVGDGFQRDSFLFVAGEIDG